MFRKEVVRILHRLEDHLSAPPDPKRRELLRKIAWALGATVATGGAICLTDWLIKQKEKEGPRFSPSWPEDPETLALIREAEERDIIPLKIGEIREYQNIIAANHTHYFILGLNPAGFERLLSDSRLEEKIKASGVKLGFLFIDEDSPEVINLGTKPQFNVTFARDAEKRAGYLARVEAARKRGESLEKIREEARRIDSIELSVESVAELIFRIQGLDKEKLKREFSEKFKQGEPLPLLILAFNEAWFYTGFK